jgi:uncharacterized repeat protein (TIGR04138 family)
MQQRSFEEGVEQILAKDTRYDIDAYDFLREALDFTQKSLGRTEKVRQREGDSSSSNEGHHVSGQQLLNGIREFAIQRYGPMTVTIFESWGIKGTEDFGNIVFNMVAEGLLGKTENDSPEDFKNVYDFDVVFRQPYLPKAKQASEPSAETPSQDA